MFIYYFLRKLDTSVEELVKEFEGVWRAEDGDYSRKLVEYFCTKALAVLCQNIEEKITDGSFSRFSFDMMLAWETPSYAEEESLRVHLLYFFPYIFCSTFFSPVIAISINTTLFFFSYDSILERKKY